MNHKSSLLKTDIFLSGLGLATTLAIFFAQGPYRESLSYLLATSPLILTLILIVFYRAFLKWHPFTKALAHAKEAYDIVTATDIRSEYIVRVLNEFGDLLYDRRIHFMLVKEGVIIRKTKEDMIGSEVEIEKFPPPTKIHSSNPDGICLTPTNIGNKKSKRAGRAHYDYYWTYEIDPPLTKKGDFVDYSYSSVIPGSEEKAFTEDGSVFFFYHSAVALEVNYSLISPPHYKILILDSFAEDIDKRRLNLSPEDMPILEKNDQVLLWQPSYRKRACFICKYKLVKV